MNRLILKSLFLLAFMVVATIAISQEQNNVTYKIVDNGSVTNIQPYIDALNSANFKYHRLRNSRNLITFDTGLKVELYSANELIANGRNITVTDYPESFPSNREVPLFVLGSNNFILEQHTSTGKHY